MDRSTALRRALVVVGLAALVRVLLAAWPPLQGDVRTYAQWSRLMLDRGPAHIYQAGPSQGELFNPNYPPGYLYVLWAAVTLVCAGAAAAGFGFLDDAPANAIAFVLAFAAGAILAMLTTSMDHRWNRGASSSGRPSIRPMTRTGTANVRLRTRSV